jgi:molybdopterin converting factor subunit 1
MIDEEGGTIRKSISVRVLFFGAARDAAGRSETTLSLATTQPVAQAFEQVLDAFPGLRRFGRSLLFAVNEEYAPAEREVRDGDELAVFPPVSGGSDEGAETKRQGDGGKREQAPATRRSDLDPGNSGNFFELTTEPIDVGAVARKVILPECGATVTLDGYAREWTKGRRTLRLVYEAYEPMALSEMQRLGGVAHERFDIAHIGIVHRTGSLEIGETSVVIAVSAPHRRAAFEACEWAIKELKRTVPIWKKEIFEDGAVWVEGGGSSV